MTENDKEIPLDQKFLNAPSIELARRLGWFYGGLTHIDQERKAGIKTLLEGKDDLFEAFIDGAAQRKIEDADKNKKNG
jgi:hypothetical protein